MSARLSNIQKSTDRSKKRKAHSTQVPDSGDLLLQNENITDADTNLLNSNRNIEAVDSMTDIEENAVNASKKLTKITRVSTDVVLGINAVTRAMSAGMLVVQE
jgi:hypothetical protein